MSTRHVNGKNGVTVISVALLSMISVNPVHADSLRPLSQYMIVQAAVDAVSLAAGELIDCNGNGIDDAQDIADLTSPDCNGNGVPDECELAGNDCDGDGRPDECGVFITCDSTEDQKLTASDGGNRDDFGGSVSISGSIAVVGARDDNCADGNDCGSAYVFRFDGTNWIEQQKLTALDAAADDHFGVSVSISGETVVVAASQDDCAAGNGCGSAYVYRFDGTNWPEEQKLTASDAAEFDLFGVSVSISGSIAVVGAYLADCADGPDCGSAYVYRFDGMNWIEEQKLTASDAAAGDLFGDSVSISGDTVVVGARRVNCAAGFDCGSAYVYRFDGTNWIEEQKLTASDAAAGDLLGGSVFVSGDTTVIGAQSAGCCGAAYVYRFNGTNWIEEQKLTASDASTRDRFGESVSISGGTAVVGAHEDSCAAIPLAANQTQPDCGSAYVYRYDGTSWIEESKLTSSDASAGDLFGTSVSISGDRIVVGADGDDGASCFACGAAYSFELTGGDCNCNSVADQCDSDCNGNGIPDDCEGLPDSDGDGVPDECDICSGSDDHGVDSDGDGRPDDCDDCDNSVPEECAILSPIFAPPPHDIRKNRYISIDPRGAGGFNAGKNFDIRLTLTDTLVNGVTVVGSQWWANEPDAACISVVGPTQPATPLSWDACSTLHLTGCPIIPASSYEIAAVLPDGLESFPPFAAETQLRPESDKWWGDAVGSFDGFVWGAPQGVTNWEDMTAALFTFLRPNTIVATHVSVTDIHPNRPDVGGFSAHPNKVVNIDDVFQFIQAFQGNQYPGGAIHLCPDP